MDTDASVVVAGGGLAGLVAARHLAERGADVTLFERRETVGGRVRTRETDGFTIDRGFQVLFTGYPAVRRTLDLDALDFREFAPGAVIARPGQRSVLSDPLRDPAAALETLTNREVTVSDKARTLALRQHVGSMEEREFFQGRDLDVRSYLREWGFSERFVENFVVPLYGGVTLDRSLSTSKQVFEYTFRAMAEGSIALPADGMDAIPAQLADRAREAGTEIRTDVAVEAVGGEDIEEEREGSGDRDDPSGPDADGSVSVETDAGTVEADAAVVATDPTEARSLTGIEAIPTEGRGCVTQYYRLPGGTQLGTGERIVLNAAELSPNTVVPLSAVAPEYASADDELLNATFLGDDALAAEDDELAAEARAALSGWFPERNFERLAVVATERVEFAQFAQSPGFRERLPDIRDPAGSVYLAGDFTEWSSIQGAMHSGHEAAEAVLSDLGSD